MAIREALLVGGIVVLAIYAQATDNGRLVAVKTLSWSKDKAAPTPVATATPVTAPATATPKAPAAPTKGITEKGIK